MYIVLIYIYHYRDIIFIFTLKLVAALSIKCHLVQTSLVRFIPMIKSVKRRKIGSGSFGIIYIYIYIYIQYLYIYIYIYI